MTKFFFQNCNRSYCCFVNISSLLPFLSKDICSWDIWDFWFLLKPLGNMAFSCTVVLFLLVFLLWFAFLQWTWTWGTNTQITAYKSSALSPWRIKKRLKEVNLTEKKSSQAKGNPTYRSTLIDYWPNNELKSSQLLHVTLTRSRCLVWKRRWWVYFCASVSESQHQI